MPVSTRKRKHSQSDDPIDPATSKEPAAAETAKSTDFYFDDGSIVLIAENVAFRVHKGQLARHSSVFRDMFSVVDQPAHGESFDGCSTVRLSDTRGDIAMLLRALYDSPQFKCNAKGVEVLTSVLRMANKYLMDPLRHTCIKALLESYPDTLARWDRYSGRQFHPKAVVQLIDADILLPSAYYALCSRSLKKVSLPQDKLPPHVLETYCKGKEVMIAWFANFFEKHFSVDGSLVDDRPDCEGPGSALCYSAWEDLESSAVSMLGDAHRIIRPNPLDMLQELVDDSSTQNMCRKCHRYLKQVIKEERSSVWELLPTFFGLGTWKELRDKYNRDSNTSQP